MNSLEIRRLNENDRPWIEHFLAEFWHSAKVVTRGRIHPADQLPGFIARQGDERVGLVTYHRQDNECEIVTLNSLAEHLGIGSALVAAVRNVATSSKCRRLWLITTNDNLAALRFYQKRGFSLVAVHPNALEHSRRLKPEIPLVGMDGIPLRDELELEMLL
jgi:ribosomal protein S18 acetylase RimI-like enzyme